MGYIRCQIFVLAALFYLILSPSCATLAAGGSRIKEQVFRAELIHREHPSSPLRSANLKTSSEIFLEAVKRGHDRQTALAQHVLAAGQSFQSPVAAGNGEYLVEISIGTPPQKFSAIVDTGSDLLWFQCLPCISCYSQTGAKFDPTKSSTYKTLGCTTKLCQAVPFPSCTTSCQYDYLYGDGSSTSGALSSETVTFASTTGGTRAVPNVAFGCGQSNLGSFSGAGGLLGLGQGPLSLISQAATVVSKKFAYCLVQLGSPKTSPLYIGDAVVAASVAYTPMLTNHINPTFYYIGITGIAVAGKVVTYPAGTFNIGASGTGGTILDSGTTLTYLQDAAYTPVLKAFQAAVKYPVADGSLYGLDFCFSTAGVANPTYPTMVFHFTNADYVVAPEQLFILLDTQGTTCLALASSTSFSIFGNIIQQDHLVVYDIVNKRVGFRSATCESL